MGAGGDQGTFGVPSLTELPEILLRPQCGSWIGSILATQSEGGGNQGSSAPGCTTTGWLRLDGLSTDTWTVSLLSLKGYDLNSEPEHTGVRSTNLSAFSRETEPMCTVVHLHTSLLSAANYMVTADCSGEAEAVS